MARRVRVRLIALGVAGAALSSGILAVSPASAQSVKAQIASAHRQLAELNSQAEAASERYDAARIKLSSAQQTAAAAQQRLSTAQQKLNALQASMTAFAIATYSGDSSTSLLTLTDGSAKHFIGRVSALQAVSTSESANLVNVEAARRVQQQAQADASAALAAQRSDTTVMAADRSQILDAAAKEQTILANLQAKEAAIIRAAKAAKAKAAQLAAERVAATLAREKAAAAEAAREVAAQPVSPPPPLPQPAPHVSAAGGAATAVAWAKAELGKPYVWGAAGPDSFDCSGLAMYVWAKAGVQLEHFTGDQWNEGTHVSQSQLEPGDLVFFAYNTSDPSTIHHVGIYVGGGQMIDAPYTGVDVRYDPAFRPDYIGAVRPG
jgi:cell wall-associated NlpC family hydrolase